MTLLPKINRTKYCITDCGNEICNCKPTKILNNNFNKTDIMQTNELRIGSYVNCEDGNIIRINKEDMMCILTQTYEVKPIPLTEEMLLKCGFDRSEYNDYRHPVLIGTLTLYEGVAELHISDMYSVWIESLHQLQNLFYVLAGEELDVKI